MIRPSIEHGLDKAVQFRLRLVGELFRVDIVRESQVVRRDRPYIESRTSLPHIPSNIREIAMSFCAYGNRFCCSNIRLETLKTGA